MMLDAIRDALTSEAFIDAIDRKIINFVQRHDRLISEHVDKKKSISNFLRFCRDFLARNSFVLRFDRSPIGTQHL